MEICIKKNSREPLLCSFAYQFYCTVEGSLIGYLRRRGKATLNELIEYVTNNKNLRTKYSKNYKNKNIEKLVQSKLLAEKRIFIESEAGVWTLDESKAMEYKLQKVDEIKKIKEKKYESKLYKKKMLKSTEAMKELIAISYLFINSLES